MLGYLVYIPVMSEYASAVIMAVLLAFSAYAAIVRAIDRWFGQASTEEKE